MKKTNGKTKFKKGDTIRSQLPSPNSRKAGKHYHIKDVTALEYVVCNLPLKDNVEKIPFKYIEGGAHLDGSYNYNYILVEEEDENIQKRD